MKSRTGNRGERKRERFLVNEVVKINIYRPLRGPQETYLPNIVEGRNGCKCFSFLLFFFCQLWVWIFSCQTNERNDCNNEIDILIWWALHVQLFPNWGQDKDKGSPEFDRNLFISFFISCMLFFFWWNYLSRPYLSNKGNPRKKRKKKKHSLVA